MELAQDVQKTPSEMPDGSADMVAPIQSKSPPKQKALPGGIEFNDDLAQKVEKSVADFLDGYADSTTSRFVEIPQERQTVHHLADAGARNLTMQEFEQDMQQLMPSNQGVDKPMELSDMIFDDVSNLLRQAGREEWSLRPRTFVVLWIMEVPELIEEFVRAETWDIALPYIFENLPKVLSASHRHQFVKMQEAVLTKAAKIENGSESSHANFSHDAETYLEPLGKIQSGLHVDRVRSNLSRRIYARKYMNRHAHFDQDQNALEIVRTEVAIMKNLHHRHLVRYIGSYTDPLYVGILIAPLAECDMRTFLSKTTPTAADSTCIRQAFGCLCAAIMYLQKKHICHNSIKPANILVDKSKVFITDFGLAHDWTRKGRSTMTGVVDYHTPPYTAPEVLEHHRSSTSSDVWSLGCVFLDMVTVLKGKTLDEKLNFFLSNGNFANSPATNRETCKEWMKELQSDHDNPPLLWVASMIQPEKEARVAPNLLMAQIRECDDDERYCGYCCEGEYNSLLTRSEDKVDSSIAVNSGDEGAHLQTGKQQEGRDSVVAQGSNSRFREPSPEVRDLEQSRVQSEAQQEAFRYVDSAYGTASHDRQNDNNAYRLRDATVQDTGDDARSEYSRVSTENSEIITYLKDFADDLFSAIYTPRIDPKHMQYLCEALEDLLQQFAFRISHEMRSKDGREIMYYMLRNRGLIAKSFRRLMPAEHDNEEGSVPALFDGISAQERILDWVEEVEPEFPEEQNLSYVSHEIPIDRYRTLIPKTSAYQWLLSIMRKNLTLIVEQKNILGSIHKEISEVLPPISKFSIKREADSLNLLYVLNWDPKTFLAGQEYAEEGTVAMERAITLTGTLTNAQALPCLQYLRQTWPTNGEDILRLMQQLLESKCGGVVRVNDRKDRSKISAWRTLSSVYVEVCGSRSSIMEIGEQLAWFGGTMRSSPFAGVALSSAYVDTHDLTQEEQDGLNHAGFQEDSTVLNIKFALHEGTADSKRYNEGRCWHNLFRNPVVVQGFPIFQRHSLSPGLEIPLNLMAALVGTARAHAFDDTMIIKGFSSMLVPTKRSENLTIWHVVFHADSTHVSYTERGSSSLRSTNFEELQTSRHIIGWCANVKGCTGRPDASYDIARSKLKKVGTSCLLENVSISLGRYVTTGMNFALAVKDIPVHVPRKPYLQKLRQLYDKFFLFWDTEDKRGWLVNGLDALLHLIRATLKHYEKDELMSLASLLKSEDILEPPRTETDEPDRAYAFNVLREELNMKLHMYPDKDTLEADNADEYNSGSSLLLRRHKKFVCLEDRVDELYEVLEKIVAYQEEKAGQAGVKIKAHIRRQLEGWQFHDLASDTDPLVPYVENLEAVGKGWVDFVRSIGVVTLFGRGFGDLIQPLSKIDCPRWGEVPKGKFYLAARVADLQHIIDTKSGDTEAIPIEVCDGISWFSPTSPFDTCLCTKGQGQKHSDFVQVLWPTRWISRLSYPKKIPLHQRGAVIFGHNVKFKWMWGDLGEPVKGSPGVEPIDNRQNGRDDGTTSTEYSNSSHYNAPVTNDTHTPLTSIQASSGQGRDPEQSSPNFDEQSNNADARFQEMERREGISANFGVQTSKRSRIFRKLKDKFSKLSRG